MICAEPRRTVRPAKAAQTRRYTGDVCQASVGPMLSMSPLNRFALRAGRAFPEELVRIDLGPRPRPVPRLCRFGRPGPRTWRHGRLISAGAVGHSACRAGTGWPVAARVRPGRRHRVRPAGRSHPGPSNPRNRGCQHSVMSPAGRALTAPGQVCWLSRLPGVSPAAGVLGGQLHVLRSRFRGWGYRDGASPGVK
jgi:hypothetical protein